MYEGPERVWDLLKIFSSNIRAQARIRDLKPASPLPGQSVRGEHDAHIAPENATNTPNLSNMLHVEDPETRPPLRSWLSSLKDHTLGREHLIKMERWGQTAIFTPRALSRFFSLKVIGQNILFLFSIKYTRAHPKVAGRMDFHSTSSIRDCGFQ